MSPLRAPRPRSAPCRFFLTSCRRVRRRIFRSCIYHMGCFDRIFFRIITPSYNNVPTLRLLIDADVMFLTDDVLLD